MNNSNQPLNNRVDQLENPWLERQRRLLESNGPEILRDRDFLQAKAATYKNMLRSFKNESLTPDEKIALRLMKATYNNTRRRLYPRLYKMGIPQAINFVTATVGIVGAGMRFAGSLVRKPAPSSFNFSAPDNHIEAPDKKPEQPQQELKEQPQQKKLDQQENFQRRHKKRTYSQTSWSQQQQGQKPK